VHLSSLLLLLLLLGCAGDYASNDELLDVLLAGAHIPRKSDGTWWARLRGHRYVDAGTDKPHDETAGGGGAALSTVS